MWISSALKVSPRSSISSSDAAMTDTPPTDQGLATQISPPRRRRHTTAAKAVIAMLVGLAVAALLSSESLVGLAERQPVGTSRDIALSAARNLHRASSFLSLDRPASALRSALDRDETTYDVAAIIASNRQNQPPAAAPASSVPTPVAPSPTGPTQPASPVATPTPPATPAEQAPPATPAGTPGTAPTPGSPVIPDASPGSPPTASTLAPPPISQPTASGVTPPATPPAAPPASRNPSSRPITEDDPLKLWAGGDSLSLSLTVGFGRVTSPTLVDFTRDTQLSSGLTRKDFLDWPQRLARLLSEDRPDVLVVMFGGNDYQDVIFNGQLLERPSQPWLDFYRSRVAEAMDLLNQPGLQVIWVGQPVMRNDFYSTGMAHLNEIYRSEAATRTSIAYFDTWNLFADPQGNYTDTIDGTLMRESDGIHLTTAGGIRLAQAIWDQAAPRWGLN